MIYRVFVQSKLTINPYVLLKIIKYYDAMNRRDDVLANSILADLKDSPASFFLSAHHAYFYGRYSDAILSLKEMLYRYPDHVESSYLLSQCLMKENKMDEALSLLYEVLKQSHRKKTWLYLSNAISNTQQFLKFNEVFSEYLPQALADKNLLSYYSDAAVKVGAYDQAIECWNNATEYVKSNGITKPQHKVYFSTDYAAQALLHLKNIMDDQKISFFLVSGTLLGCIRNNGILPHDKDLDVGVWNDDIKLDNLIAIFQNSGCFEIMPIKTKVLLKLKHVNGAFIDIFIHYREANYNWHATSKLRWINSNFNLVKKEFLGSLFNIPENYDQYLTENYGSDWRVPQLKFDSTFDTPNAEVASIDELKVYLYRKLFESSLYTKDDQDYLLTKLREIKD